MNTGQTMIVIAAMLLLGTLSLGVNKTLLNTSTTSLEMEASLDALSYGQSLLDEIMSKEFDEKTINQRAFNYSEITPVAGLGVDAGETIALPDSSSSDNFKSKKHYDDVDDYRQYARVARNARLDDFTLTVQVEYVDEDTPENLAGSPTFCKRVTVTITNASMPKDTDGNVFPLVISDLSVYRRYF